MKDQNARAGASSAVNVLAVVIPAVATIGAAAFGATVSYQAAKQTSAAKDQVNAAEKQATSAAADANAARTEAAAATNAKNALVNEVRQRLPRLQGRLEQQILAPIEEALPSPPNERVFHLTAGQALPTDLRVEGDAIQDVRADLAALEAAVNVASS
jgi:hypothetical protein